ncbi:MAG: hypothetical protein FJ280_15290 [Planctomycetes bacterium]|nr:hypothetical protein [Planctomycetota bacterium]
MSDLRQQIDEHRQALAALGRRIDQVLVAVDSFTAEARERLAEYQVQKRLAGESLGAAGQSFHAAHLAFGKAGELLTDLEVLKAVHVGLSHAVNELLTREPDSEAARRVLTDFMAIRRSLKRTFRRIDRCRREARLAEAPADGAADPETDGAGPLKLEAS